MKDVFIIVYPFHFDFYGLEHGNQVLAALVEISSAGGWLKAGAISYKQGVLDLSFQFIQGFIP
ncbi:hypothetical protein [Eubacterium sp. F2]|uniref:hypothetical protein n=1 Tax=Eubacterium sp. F2 TaxID=3381348 RepID=UPI0039080BC2